MSVEPRFRRIIHYDSAGNEILETLTDPTITNLTLTLANTWYPITLQTTTKAWLAKARTSTHVFDYDFTVAHTTYITVNAGDAISEDTRPTIIYFRSASAGAIIEFEEWE